MRFVGLVICLVIVAGAVSHINLDLYNDILSAQFVLGGATGYTLIGWKSGQWSKNFGKGAVFFGWMGTMIGFIAVTGQASGDSKTSQEIVSAISVALLPIFYGYLVKLICITIKPSEHL